MKGKIKKEVSEEEITLEEIRESIGWTKQGKAPRYDNIMVKIVDFQIASEQSIDDDDFVIEMRI